VVIVEGVEAVLDVNLGLPLLSIGNLLCSCAIMLSFEVVSGVGRGICIRGGPRVPRGREGFGVLFPIALGA